MAAPLAKTRLPRGCYKYVTPTGFSICGFADSHTSRIVCLLAFTFAFVPRTVIYFVMSKIEEIEQAVEKLPLADFVKLAVWVDQRRQQLEISRTPTERSPVSIRDHSAFLNSYSPQDEGLYDDATAG